MSSRPDRTVWFPLGLLLLAGVFLVLKASHPMTGNFAPAMALAFTGSLLLPRAFRLWAPLAVVMLADVAISGSGIAVSWETFLVKWACLGAASLLALRFAARPGVLAILGGCLCCSIGYYLAMNSLSWLLNPAYAKSLAGWIQANTTGEPGYLPAWMFLRNSVVSDQLFSLMLVLLFNREAAWKGLPRISWKRLEAAPA